jgi:hypothetical protein
LTDFQSGQLRRNLRQKPKVFYPACPFSRKFKKGEVREARAVQPQGQGKARPRHKVWRARTLTDRAWPTLSCGTVLGGRCSRCDKPQAGRPGDRGRIPQAGLFCDASLLARKRQAAVAIANPEVAILVPRKNALMSFNQRIPAAKRRSNRMAVYLQNQTVSFI